MLISLILPCYNPADGWVANICENYSVFCQLVEHPVELVLVMDGEGQGVTENDLLSLQQSIPQLILRRYAENMGKGYAIRQGVAAAAGDIILYTDVDFPYTTDSLMTIYRSLHANECDVAVGVKNDAYYTHVPLMRRVISRYLRFFIRIFLSMPITDTQCGLKGFRRHVIPLFLQTTINRYLFDLEFIRNCYAAKSYRVKAIPVTLKENIQFRSMNYRILLPEMLNFSKLLFKRNS